MGIRQAVDPASLDAAGPGRPGFGVGGEERYGVGAVKHRAGRLQKRTLVSLDGGTGVSVLRRWRYNASEEVPGTLQVESIDPTHRVFGLREGSLFLFYSSSTWARNL